MRVVADDVFAQKICIVDGQRNYMYLEGVSRKVLQGVAYKGYKDSDDVPMMLNDGRWEIEGCQLPECFPGIHGDNRRFRLSYLIRALLLWML